MSRISKHAFSRRPGQNCSKYFAFQRASCPGYHQVLVCGLIKRRTLLPTRKSHCYTFPDAKSADCFFECAPRWKVSKNLKDYGIQGEEAWKQFDHVFQYICDFQDKEQ